MSDHNSNKQKRYKKPKHKTQKTTNPEGSNSKRYLTDLEDSEFAEPLYPLAAKDSGWVDVFQMPRPVEIVPSKSTNDEEEVECDDDIQMKPLVLMFPGLLERDPQTLQSMLHRAMSTTDVTRQLVNLNQKADFTFMKKSNRLIPRDKQWLEKVVEDSDSHKADAEYIDAYALPKKLPLEPIVVSLFEAKNSKNEFKCGYKTLDKNRKNIYPFVLGYG